MSNLFIRTDEYEILHKKCKDVKFPLDFKTKELIDDMKNYLLTTEYATGLAANQVGSDLNLFVYRTDYHPSPMVMINPIIIKSGDLSHGQCEMCLSYPKQIYKVVRAKRIAVRFFDEMGEHYVLKYRGFEAMIIQHEIDHLLGITIKDRGVKISDKVAKEVLGMLDKKEDLTDEEGFRE